MHALTILQDVARSFRTPLAAAAACCVAAAALSAPETIPEPEVVSRSVRLEARLVDVERLPPDQALSLARYRIVSDTHRGGTLSLVYSGPPVQLERWDVHDASGMRRLGGGRVREAAAGQWDALLRDADRPAGLWGGFFRAERSEPATGLALTVTERDLDGPEPRTHWMFTKLDGLVALDDGTAVSQELGPPAP